MQRVYAPQLKELGIIDDIIWEKAGENYEAFPTAANNLVSFLETSLDELQAMSPDQVVAQRYSKFRSMGKFKEYAKEEREKLVSAPAIEKQKSRKIQEVAAKNPGILDFLMERTLTGEHS